MNKTWLSQADCADAKVILSEIFMPQSQGSSITDLHAQQGVPEPCDLWGVAADLTCYVGVQLWDLLAY